MSNIIIIIIIIKIIVIIIDMAHSALKKLDNSLNVFLFSHQRNLSFILLNSVIKVVF